MLLTKMIHIVSLSFVDVSFMTNDMEWVVVKVSIFYCVSHKSQIFKLNSFFSSCWTRAFMWMLTADKKCTKWCLMDNDHELPWA